MRGWLCLLMCVGTAMALEVYVGGGEWEQVEGAKSIVIDDVMGFHVILGGYDYYCPKIHLREDGDTPEFGPGSFPALVVPLYFHPKREVFRHDDQLKQCLFALLAYDACSRVYSMLSMALPPAPPRPRLPTADEPSDEMFNSDEEGSSQSPMLSLPAVPRFGQVVQAALTPPSSPAQVSRTLAISPLSPSLEQMPFSSHHLPHTMTRSLLRTRRGLHHLEEMRRPAPLNLQLDSPPRTPIGGMRLDSPTSSSHPRAITVGSPLSSPGGDGMMGVSPTSWLINQLLDVMGERRQRVAALQQVNGRFGGRRDALSGNLQTPSLGPRYGAEMLTYAQSLLDHGLGPQQLLSLPNDTPVLVYDQTTQGNALWVKVEDVTGHKVIQMIETFPDDNLDHYVSKVSMLHCEALWGSSPDEYVRHVQSVRDSMFFNPFIMDHCRPEMMPILMWSADDALRQFLQLPVSGASRSQVMAAIGKIHWFVAIAMPFLRGSAAAMEWLATTLAASRGHAVGRRNTVIDMRAFHMSLNEFMDSYDSFHVL